MIELVSKYLVAFILPFWLVLSFALTAFVGTYWTSKNKEEAKFHFDSNATEKLRQVVGSAEEVFKSTYEVITTISRFPTVKKLNQQGTNLTDDDRATLMQVFYSLTKQWKVSKVYISVLGFDPAKSHPITKKREAPTLTLDLQIATRQLASESNDTAESIPEVFDHEYMEILSHLKYFEKNYGLLRQIIPSNPPGIIGNEIVTSDNSDMKFKEALSGNNKARLGFCYSVPIYGLDGQFKGVVTAVIRHKIMSEVIGDYFKLRRDGISISGGTNEAKAPFAYNFGQKLTVADGRNWYVEHALSAASFEEAEFTKAKKKEVQLIIFFGLLLSLISTGIIWLYVRGEAKSNKIANNMMSFADVHREVLIESLRKSTLGEMTGSVSNELFDLQRDVSKRFSKIRSRFEQSSLAHQNDENWSKLENSLQKISRLIKGLQSMARDASQDTLSATSLVMLVSDSVEICQHRCTQMGVEIETNIPAEILIECRSIEMGQVLVSLINQSLDSLEKLSQRWIRIEAFQIQSYVEITITDSGLGFSKEVSENLFQSLFVVKAGQKSKGIGLGVATGIIKSLHGEFFLNKNFPNTQFVIRLPLKQPVQNTQQNKRTA